MEVRTSKTFYKVQHLKTYLMLLGLKGLKQPKPPVWSFRSLNRINRKSGTGGSEKLLETEINEVMDGSMGRSPSVTL